MSADLLKGKLVQLVAVESEIFAPLIARWSRDSEYWRLLSSGVCQPFSLNTTKEWIKKYLETEKPDSYAFMIRALSDERVIGDIELDGIHLSHGDGFVGLGIGERELWGKGYGTDAMQVVLRFAFLELNLHRVSLNVFEYNPRAIRSYEKVGFKHEGRQRKALHRDGQRWDVVYMGITRTEWQEKHS